MVKLSVHWNCNRKALSTFPPCLLAEFVLGSPQFKSLATLVK